MKSKMGMLVVTMAILCVVICIRVVLKGSAGSDEPGEPAETAVGDGRGIETQGRYLGDLRLERAPRMTTNPNETGDLKYLDRLTDTVSNYRNYDIEDREELAGESSGVSLLIEPIASREGSGNSGIPAAPELISVESSPEAVGEPIRSEGDDENFEGPFVPYGETVKCELLYTVDSTQQETPIVGYVVEDFYWNGHLVIPANTKVHGVAQVDRTRDRIYANEQWVLVFPQQGSLVDGREMNVSAKALDRIELRRGLSWGIEDGSFGLRGYEVRSKSLAELKLFASTFLGAAASGLEETETTLIAGELSSSTPKNAALEGLSSVMERTAQKLLAEIEKNGVYIRVPSGKQFYLYFQQTVILNEAQVAATRL